MSKQVIDSRGTTLSTVEVWNRMFNKDFIFDTKGPSITVVAILFWAAVLYLGTAYTTSITPSNALLRQAVVGTELDFDSNEFWDWYSYQDDGGKYNRTITRCQWTTYNNSNGATTFPTCPYNGDPVNFLSAGFTAAQQGLSLSRPSINYLDKHFEGSTSGALPQGWAGFPAFSNVKFQSWCQDANYSSFSYSLTQQGLTADVSCPATPDSPINSTWIGYIDNTIPGLDDGAMNIVNFTWTFPNGQVVASSGASTAKTGSSQIVVPKQSWATLVGCQSPDIEKSTRSMLVHSGHM